MNNIYLFNFIVFLIITINANKNVAEDCDIKKLEVIINQGKLIGKCKNDYWSNNFYSYEGIPYAMPPIGALRFKAPKPPKPWYDVLNATEPRKFCPQANINFNLIDEDCLFLNIYSKMMEELKPVMVWIHGGAFVEGSGSFYGPEFLISQDIVLVTIQYRLNAFGFMSFTDQNLDVSGNAGLKDQIMALKWIQDNIAFFGGDPNRVTIFGESAGGASVHLLYLSPLSKGLFHSAIAQSGAATNPWVTAPNRYRELASILACNDTRNQANIFECFKIQSTKDLIEAQDRLLKIAPLKTGELGAFNAFVVEQNTKNAFLTEEPEQIILKGKFNKVPFMTGFCTHEGAKFVSINSVQPNFTDSQTLIPKNMNIIPGSHDAEVVGNKIKEFYYGSQNPSYDLILPFCNYLTDIMFVEQIHYHAQQQANIAPEVPVYFYNFNYHTRLNAHTDYNITNLVSHGDDVVYEFIFPQTPSDLKPFEDAYNGMHRLITFWTNFAKEQNPNSNLTLNEINWKPINKDMFYYNDINPNMSLKIDPLKDRMQFWKNLYSKYGRRKSGN